MAIGSLVHRDPFFPFHRAFGFTSANPAGQFNPNIDAEENDDEYRVIAELPGLEEDDFSVEIEDGVLTLKGEKKTRYVSDDEAEPQSGYRRVEARWGRFERRLRFGAEVDEDAVKATYKNGVLEVVVPKVVPAQPEVRTIPIQTN